jgi:hypothetical protein
MKERLDITENLKLIQNRMAWFPSRTRIDSNAMKIVFEKCYAENIFQSRICALRSSITHEKVLAHTRFIHSWLENNKIRICNRGSNNGN